MGLWLKAAGVMGLLDIILKEYIRSNKLWGDFHHHWSPVSASSPDPIHFLIAASAGRSTPQATGGIGIGILLIPLVLSIVQ